MSLKVDVFDDGALCVRFPARRWETAHDVIESLKENPPSGYRLVESQVKPRGVSKSGRRCNVRLFFNYVDDRVLPLDVESGLKEFTPYMLRAQGVLQ